MELPKIIDIWYVETGRIQPYYKNASLTWYQKEAHYLEIKLFVILYHLLQVTF